MATGAREASWRWEGRDHRGERVRGRLTATTLPLARAELRRRGIAPLRVHREHAPRGKRIRASDIAYISRQLATMIAAGVPIAQAFGIIGQGHENRRMRRLCAEIRGDIEAGSSLSQALAKHPRYFDHLYVSLVATGEQSGQLDEILGRIATYKEKTESLKRKIKKALFYPAAVVCAAIIVTAILLIFVIPKFQDFYSSFGASLPAFTRWVIGFSRSVQNYGWIYLLVVIFLIVLIIQLRKHSPGFRRGMDRLLLRIPVIGTIMRKAAIARFARTLSITFAAGVPITEALATVARSTGNILYQDAVLQASQRVASGERLHRALEERLIFPNMVTQMIAIGEESGSVDEMSGKVADFYEEEVDTLVDGLSTLLEPVIIVVLGIIVGALVVAMYLPIFNLGNVL
ncbi:MAG TPA: type II secretion system F family protein [Gammaproteobacteria bacterium]|nr:type II secretion system F family protein [Gammaproteobacteria bacterium]